MKNYFILLMILQLGSTARAQYVIEKSPIVISMEEGIVPCCRRPACRDSVCYTLPVKRNNINQMVIVLIPQSHTSSAVDLYPEIKYYKYKDNPQQLDWSTKVRDQRILIDGQPLTLNLTNLEDGNYIVNYKSDLGGLLKVTLITE